jgi:hypothetical protein
VRGGGDREVDRDLDFDRDCELDRDSDRDLSTAAKEILGSPGLKPRAKNRVGAGE